MQSTSSDGIHATFKAGHQEYAVLSFTGAEGLNEPYCFTLIIHAPDLLSPDVILGQPAQLTLRSSIADAWPMARPFAGVITHHRILNADSWDAIRIELTLSPRLSLLSHSSEPRVYLNQSAQELARHILLKHGYDYGQLRFFDSYLTEKTRYPHWVQAEGEDDFRFLHRVLAREGISYFWRFLHPGEESLDFVDDTHFYPDVSGPQLHLAEPGGFSSTDLSALSDLNRTEQAATYRVTYRDFDPSDPERVMEVHAGKGARPVMVWGIGAQSHQHLQRAATHHHQQLMMRQLEYQAYSANPFLPAGHGIRIRRIPYWLTEESFLLLNVAHCFEDGAYHNTLTFIPKHTPVRPKPVTRAAGQLMHTATIHASDDLPHLDKHGQYTYFTHIHQDEDAQPALQKAQRLTPFGGQALHQAMGMHFPLKRQSEVLVMYLHNDFNQPVLQNSPNNGLNHAPVTRDNSWSVLLKTAWGQYLEFCDRHGLGEVTLSNANGHNRLHLQAHEGQHEAALKSERGFMSFHAEGPLGFQSEDEIIIKAQDVNLNAENDSRIEAEAGVHLQANEQTFASETLHIESERHIEASANGMRFQSEGSLSIQARGELLQMMLPNGDMLWEAEHLDLHGAQALSLHGDGASIHLSDAGIALEAERVCIQAGVVNGPLIEQAPLPAQSVPDWPGMAALSAVPYFSHGLQKRIKPVDWDKPIYTHNDVAFIHVAIKGFNGYETGHLIIARHHHPNADKPLPRHPKLAYLSNAKDVDRHAFSLTDASLYVDERQAKTTLGTANLRIPYPLHDLLKRQGHRADVHDPYYVRVELGDAKSEAYSNAMVLLAPVAITLCHDKGQTYTDHDAILKLTRALPLCVKASPHAPSQNEARYYRQPTRFEHLPAGRRNVIRLFEQGQYRELLREDFTIPSLEQTLDVHLDEQNNNDITLPRLMPPMIFDLRHAEMNEQDVVFTQDTPHARMELSDEEIEYIQANGNNLTVFIHGYNVDYGDFHPHLSATIGADVPNQRLGKATIHRDAAFLHAQFPQAPQGFFEAADECRPEHLNGTGLHEWVTHFEHQMNCAAGFDGKHYDKFSRCLFIAWPGKPASSADYVKAAYESIRMGPIVAKALEALHHRIPNLKLYVVAHSQGNGVLLHALNHLNQHVRPLVEHAFFWQAAISNNALSDHGLYGNNPPSVAEITELTAKNPWFCPHAHKGAHYITILYSKNDNILGHLLRQKEQPEGVQIKDVWERKPVLELSSGLLIGILNLESIYCLANWVDAPASELLHEDTLKQVWKKWRHHHPKFHSKKQEQSFDCAETLEEQAALLESLHLAHILNQDFTEQISAGIENVHELLHDRFEHLETVENGLDFASDFAVGGAGKTAGIVLALGNAMQTYIKKQKKSPKNKIKNWKKKILRAIIRKIIVTHYQGHLQNLLTFSQTVFLNDGIGERPALGYEGPDLKDPFLDQLYKSGKLNPVDGTEWVWHHSDMKIGSRDILNRLYDDAIFKGEAMQFGLYTKKGNKFRD